MNTTYLSIETITNIANQCEAVLTNKNKNRLKELSDKFGVQFGGDSQTNRNML